MTSTRTTRYVTLLSVVLALALTAALAACGSDEPSGVTVPDRTASTPTETPAFPRTDAFHARVRGRAHCHRYARTAAATAPPAASGSAETDREALVAFYNATDGENWSASDNWLSGPYRPECRSPRDRSSRRRHQDNALSVGRYGGLGSLSVTTLNLEDNALERGDTAGAGQPLQPDRAAPQLQRLERGDTGGVGQPLQPINLKTATT